LSGTQLLAAPAGVGRHLARGGISLLGSLNPLANRLAGVIGIETRRRNGILRRAPLRGLASG
jgi:hypothetical protein